jgi:hypothetical protein
MLFLVAAVSALLLPSPADARDWRRSGAFLQTQAQKADKDRDQYGRGSRDARRAERNGGKPGGRERLTEEERQELHRDLDRARREIYRRGRKR